MRLALSAGYVNAGTVEFLVEAEGKVLLSGDEYAAAGGASGDGAGDRAGPGADADWGGEGSRCRCAGGCAAARPCDRVPDLCGGSGEWVFPSPGRITRLLQPAGPGIREDCGVYEGWEVPLEYDPMLSKLVAFGATREAAIERMLRALGEYVVGGIKTNVGLFQRILRDGEFRAGRIDTGYLERLLAAGPAAG